MSNKLKPQEFSEGDWAWSFKIMKIPITLPRIPSKTCDHSGATLEDYLNQRIYELELLKEAHLCLLKDRKDKIESLTAQLEVAEESLEYIRYRYEGNLKGIKSCADDALAKIREMKGK